MFTFLLFCSIIALVGDIMKERIVMRLNAAPGVKPEPMGSEEINALKRSYRAYSEQNKKDFAARLKTLRESAKMTQKQLADKAGLHEGLITRYETAGAIPRDSTLQKLAAALNVPVKAFDPDAIKLLDFTVFGNYGVKINFTNSGVTFSVPGYPDITVENLKELVALYDLCNEQTEKAFQKVKEDYFVNLFIRELFYDEIPRGKDEDKNRPGTPIPSSGEKK